ncbi:hypothetical protein ACFL03_06335 [Thermodesulfobacteriota bacterium]
MPNPATNQKRNDPVVTVKGIIVPVEWDIRGCPVALALATDQETEYLIDTEDTTGRALFKFLRQKVKVTGLLDGRAVRNRQVITVKGVVVIKK